ncbi:MAG TPA: ABC transporter family substrate-binding protein [Pseudonocardia sp.]|jgi:peptide/nickel transport system substrate-binding protein|uniref:ABC transporter family substrate-binding protein n=1 Tax=Pseudonocardia sp. TaxID=60912 RepID=UPI002F4081BD
MINRRRALQGGGLFAGSLFLAACGVSAPPGQLRNQGENSGRSDINAKPREQVRDGGELRHPLEYLVTNLNQNQFDGADATGGLALGPLVAGVITTGSDGELRPNPDYLVAAELISPSPQTLRYTINPKATWSDGNPITWRDFEAQWKALNGTNPAFQVASTIGYSDMASVVRGVDDKQTVVTFARPFAEWKGLFSPLYPASTNSDPTAFNTGWINKIPVTAGPFKFDALDLTAKTLTVSRDSRWWGEPPKLDRIIFKVYETTALADALANNEIDFYPISSSIDLFRRAQAIPGVAIRQSTERLYSHITFNGAPGAILSDVKLRQAIAKGIDRGAITTRIIGQIVPNAAPLGSHVFPIGTKEYRDNSAVVAFDRAASNRELDALGWVRQGPVRAKGGKPLRMRLVGDTGNPTSDLILRTVQDQLGQVGVALDLVTLDSNQKGDAIHFGDFDLIGFQWQLGTAPFSGSRGLYAEPKGKDVQQNYGRIYSPAIIDLFNWGTVELDDAKRAEIGNQADQLIWQEVHHLPTYPSTGAYAVRSTLTNFGAPGFADIDYINAGFAK